jgi:L-amino acid N-acyltransferase YncA
MQLRWQDGVMLLRDFDDADWPQVYRIVREVTEAGETYAYDPAWTEAESREAWVERAPGRTIVAVEEGPDGAVVMGSAHLGPNRPARGSHVGTASFMVGSDARGRGVGRLLGERVLALAREDGYAAMQFNAVVETNSAAVHLWQELGFRIIGTVPEAFEHPTHGRVGLHVMHRFLDRDEA